MQNHDKEALGAAKKSLKENKDKETVSLMIRKCVDNKINNGQNEWLNSIDTKTKKRCRAESNLIVATINVNFNSLSLEYNSTADLKEGEK